MKLPRFEAGYWITPKGKFFLVEGTHIDTICNHPYKFGTDQTSLISVFNSHNESYGMEGRARTHIILCLIKKGWIRCRNYPKRGWTLNVTRLTPRTKMRVTNFFLRVYEGSMGYDDVRLDHPEGILRTSVPEILAFGLFGGKPPRNLSQHRLTFIDSASLIPDNEVVRVRFT
jgi:hypothetical protein